MTRATSSAAGSIAFVTIALALLALAAIAGGASAAGSTGAVAANATTPTPNASASFAEYTAVMKPDEETEVTVSLTATDEAQLRIGGPTTDYEATVNVTDGNGDGTVVVAFTPATAGGDETAFAAQAESDSVTVVNETSLDDPGLSSANLPAAVAVNGTEKDQMTWLVRPPMERGTTATTTSAGSTTTTAATDPGDATATPTDTPTDTPADTTDSSGGSGPGFGVAAAVVALLGGALLARKQ